MDPRHVQGAAAGAEGVSLTPLPGLRIIDGYCVGDYSAGVFMTDVVGEAALGICNFSDCR